MRIGAFHLTYCSNIHPGERWDEIRRNLGTALPAIRRTLAFDGPFGIGLRLSAAAAETLEDPSTLESFQRFLRDGDYYVFTINGFPYGAFHGQRVKEHVYLPDWCDEKRLHYSNRLARILAALLPSGLEGSVSTVPGAFRPLVRSTDDVRRIARALFAHAAVLKRLRNETGRTIALALEPEPRCFLESIDDVVRFFAAYLFNSDERESAGEEARGLTLEDVRRHIGVCFDACHMAVEFEEPASALARLEAAGIRVCKFQISSALRMTFREGDGQVHAHLGPFAEDTYLHQVVERTSAGDLVRYTDLPEALATEAATTANMQVRLKPDATSPGTGSHKEWRVHFHVPIFLPAMRGLDTTQPWLASLLDLLRRRTPCPFLEVETYTWDVLPREYRNEEVASAIARELAWVRDRLS